MILDDAQQIKHVFIELLPATIEEWTLYVSIEYKALVHLCFCGCKKKVTTPLSPTGWRITFDGRAVSVHPSIGNWNLACRSHYWLFNDRVLWSEQWTQNKIDAGFARDMELKERYYRDGHVPDEPTDIPSDREPVRIGPYCRQP